MEFYKIRYNIYKLFNKSNIYFKNILSNISINKYLIYSIFLIFLFIFIVGFDKLNYLTIFFIILLIIFIYLSNLIDEKITQIKTNKFFVSYKYNYELFNKFFIYSLNQIPNIDKYADKSSSIDYISNLYRLYLYLKKTCCFMENILKEDFDDFFSNLKTNNDVLKYIDIYNQSFISIKYWLLIKIEDNDEFSLYIDENYNENKDKNIDDYNNELLVGNIIKIINIDENEEPFNLGHNYYLINLIELNDNRDKLRNEYIKNIYNYILEKFELKEDDIDYLKETDFNIKESIIESIDNFNNILIKLLIVLILLGTIILHICFYKFYSHIY